MKREREREAIKEVKNKGGNKNSVSIHLFMVYVTSVSVVQTVEG